VATAGAAKVTVAEAAQGQTTINQKAAAITADRVVAAETAAAMAVAAASGNGDGGNVCGNVGGNAAAMAVVTAGCGRPMWAEVIFLTICITVRTYVITIVRHMAWQNTKVFCGKTL